MHPFQGRVPRAHYALSEVVPAVYEMLRRDVVKVAGAGVPIRRVRDVLCGGGKDSRQPKFTKLLSRGGEARQEGSLSEIHVPGSAIGEISPRTHVVRALGGEGPACWGARCRS